MGAFVEEGNISLSVMNKKSEPPTSRTSSIVTKMWKNTGQYFGGEKLSLFSLGVNSLRLLLLFLASSPPPFLNPHTLPREFSTALAVERLWRRKYRTAFLGSLKVREMPVATVLATVGSSFMRIYILKLVGGVIVLWVFTFIRIIFLNNVKE